MPSIPEKKAGVSALNSVDLTNSILNEVSALSDGANYADLAPRAVKPGDTLPNGNIATMTDAVNSLRAIGNIMMEYQPFMNAFINVLVNRIAFVLIKSRLYENPLSMFKKGVIEYGETVEELFVQMCDPHQYDPDYEDGTPFKRENPNIAAAFHAMNFQKFYKQTVSHDDLRTAFLSYNGITDLVGKIIEQLYTSAYYDEFLVMKYMIARLALNGNIYPFTIPEPTAANARSVTTTMVSTARDLQFMHNQYNEAGVTTYTDPSKLYVLLTNKVSSVFDVEVLALSFNMSKAELIGRQIYIDSFSTWDTARLAKIFKDDIYTSYTPFTQAELTKLASIQALMVDESFFMIFDNFIKMTEIYNPEKLYWNYFLHKWSTFSASPFAQAVLFNTQTSAVTAVTVSTNVTTAVPGAQVQATATVSGTGFVSSRVDWTVGGNVSPATTINAQGILTIAKNETATSLTVKATSIDDNTKSGTASVAVTQS